MGVVCVSIPSAEKDRRGEYHQAHDFKGAPRPRVHDHLEESYSGDTDSLEIVGGFFPGSLLVEGSGCKG